MESYEEQEKVTLACMKEYDQMKVDFPDFQGMGVEKMADYLCQNATLIKRHFPKDYRNQILKHHTVTGLEIWCKEVFVKLQAKTN